MIPLQLTATATDLDVRTVEFAWLHLFAVAVTSALPRALWSSWSRRLGAMRPWTQRLGYRCQFERTGNRRAQRGHAGLLPHVICKRLSS